MRTIRVNAKLVEELSYLALQRHHKLRGGLAIEVENAIKEYLEKESGHKGKQQEN